MAAKNTIEAVIEAADKASKEIREASEGLGGLEKPADSMEAALASAIIFVRPLVLHKYDEREK